MSYLIKFIYWLLKNISGEGRWVIIKDDGELWHYYGEKNMVRYIKKLVIKKMNDEAN